MVNGPSILKDAQLNFRDRKQPFFTSPGYHPEELTTKIKIVVILEFSVGVAARKNWAWRAGFERVTFMLMLFSLDGVSLSTPVNEEMGDFVKATDVVNVNGNGNVNGGTKWNVQDNQNVKPDRVVRV